MLVPNLALKLVVDVTERGSNVEQLEKRHS